MRKVFVILAFFVFCLSVSAQNYSIERYLNIRVAGSPTFSPDGKRIAFLTNITGTSQIWFVDAAGGYPEQITAFQDNISFTRWLPDNKGLIFGKAVGGNENTQFFHLSGDGANIKPLTADEKTRHNFGGISKDGNSVFYTSNKRDKNWFDVYRMEIASGKEEMLFQDNSSNFIAAVSDTGDKIIVSRSSVRFSLDNDLYLIDAKTKQAEHLTPHTEATQFGDVHFLPGGNSIIFGTNQTGEFITLSRMDLATKKIVPYDEAKWDLDATAISRDGQTFANTNNTEGFSELFIRALMPAQTAVNFQKMSAKRTQVKSIPLPAKGIVGGLEFSKDASKLAFTFSSAKYNGDIWVYDLKTEKLTQVTKSSRSGIPQESFVEPELIKFKSFDGREIPAWYYKPPQKAISDSRVRYWQSISQNVSILHSSVDKDVELLDRPDDLHVSVKEKETQKIDGGDRSIKMTFGTGSGARTFNANFNEPYYNNNKFPVIVSVHGGPEGQERPGFNPLYQYYLSRGYAVLATNVRGSTGYGKTFAALDNIEKREDSVKDLAASVEWLKTSGGADEKRIAVMGGSYGGYMTMAAITLYPELFAAAVNTVGIVNWETFLKNTSGYRRRQREVEYGFLDKDIEFLRKISPIAKVDRIKTPLFVIHGKNDPRVPYTEAEQLVEALKKRNVAVEYKLFMDEGHGISKLKNRLELYPLVADFLDKYMK